MTTELELQNEPKKGLSTIQQALVFGGILLVIMVATVMLTGDSKGPVGKSWISNDGLTEYSFGDTYGKGSNFLNYSSQLFDRMGNPARNIHRTGTFAFDSNIINCHFDDGQPPYKLEYKKVNGEWCIVDDNEAIFIWDDPAKRK